MFGPGDARASATQRDSGRSLALVVPGVTEPSILEALACREGLALATDLYLPRVHVASDCQSVVNDIAAGQGGKYEVIIKKIIDRKSSFNLYNFVHEKRGLNYEAQLGFHLLYNQVDILGSVYLMILVCQ